jgi:type IV pilus assembly protein PilP
MNRTSTALWVCVTLLVAAGCSEKISQSTYDGGTVKRVPVAQVDAGTADAAPPKVAFQESEFTESNRSRDPFRSYAKAFAEEAKSEVKSQRKVVLDKYSLDELKLIGIVTRVHPAKAMLVDPNGKGYVVQPGQFVGRPETVQSPGQDTTYEVNWRVDRIRPTDIVLVREDPSNPDVPTATRVIPLRPKGEEQPTNGEQ